MAMFQLGKFLVECGKSVSVVYDSLDTAEFFHEWQFQFLGPKNDFLVFEKALFIENSIYISTETALSELRFIANSNKIWLYMLSVDNCNIFGLPPIKLEARIRHIKNVIIKLPASWENSWSKVSKRISLVLSQSYYANEVLSRIKPSVPYYFIGDFTNFTNIVPFKNIKFDFGKIIKVAYNPSKGRLYFKLAHIFAKNIKFIPIINIKPENLHEFFESIDVYVDFGGQPGKDRLPREALLMGIPTFVFNRGAGANGSDFPSEIGHKLNLFSIFNLYKKIIVACKRDSFESNAVRVAEILSEREVMRVRLLSLLQTLEKYPINI